VHNITDSHSKKFFLN